MEDLIEAEIFAVAVIHDMDTKEEVGTAYFDAEDGKLKGWSVGLSAKETVVAQHIHAEKDSMPGLVAIPLTILDKTVDGVSFCAYGEFKEDELKTNSFYSSLEDFFSKGAYIMFHTQERPAGAYVGKLVSIETFDDGSLVYGEEEAIAELGEV